MTPTVAELRTRGVIGAIDAQLARTLGRIAQPHDTVDLAVALCSRHTREGHVCLDLDSVAGRPVLDAEGSKVSEFSYPELTEWQRALARSPLIGGPEATTPLVLDGENRLYLRRYFEHEARLAAALRRRISAPTAVRDRELARNALRRYFGAQPPEPDWQRHAAIVAALQSLCIVSGGPGTGKTTTVVRLLALLAELLCAQGRIRPRLLLLAPTGKAAARLVEAVKRARAGLDLPAAIGDAIPEEASTIHRALGSVGGSATRFRFDARRQLAADVVVVDEASMVDVALMRRLVDAVPDSARLVLLGDADQLASVEAGAVLADLCGGDRRPAYSLDFANRVKTVFGEHLPAEACGPHTAPLADSVVRLTRNYRFDDKGQLSRLAACVREGDVDGAMRLLQDAKGKVRFVPLEPAMRPAALLRAAAVEGFAPALERRSAIDALGAFERFRILCAHRRGPWGVEAINALAERALSDAGILVPASPFYAGRPIIITRNDYGIGLFNGDVGILWPEGPNLRAYFTRPDGGVRAISPARLPPHETAFALSVHKSQGSEFDEVAVVLPEPGSPLLSRELVYTAITRARRSVTLFAPAESVIRAVSTQVRRASGLAEALVRSRGD